MVYGKNKFTLVKTAEKTQCKSRSLPINEVTMCGAQDLNTRVKVKLADSYFVVDTTYATDDAQSTHSWPLCLGVDNFVRETISSNKMTRSIQLGNRSILLERPYEQPLIASVNRLVASRFKLFNIVMIL